MKKSNTSNINSLSYPTGKYTSSISTAHSNGNIVLQDTAPPLSIVKIDADDDFKRTIESLKEVTLFDATIKAFSSNSLHHILLTYFPAGIIHRDSHMGKVNLAEMINLLPYISMVADRFDWQDLSYSSSVYWNIKEFVEIGKLTNYKHNTDFVLPGVIVMGHIEEDLVNMLTIAHEIKKSQGKISPVFTPTFDNSSLVHTVGALGSVQ